MLFSADLANLLLYCVQQLGVMLGVGAETIMLAAYLISMRDGVVDEKETQYARAIKRVMSVALILIILSGIGITVLHVMAGESAIIFTPAFLFKWLLVVLAAALTGLRKTFPTASIAEGVIGGTWYALFLVHILAPVTGWINLGILYVIWLAGFVICWEVLVVMRREKNTKPTAPKPPAPIPAPIVKKAEPVVDTTPKPTITLGADLHSMPSTKMAAPQKSVAPLLLPVPIPTPKPVPLPPPPPVAPPPPPPVIKPVPPVTKKEEKITMDVMFPISSTTLPAGKVTDTPFLPAVPALQPIPTIKEAPPTFVPTSTLTTPPGGTSSMQPTPPLAAVPVPEPGLSALNVMPKNPDAVNTPK